MKKKEEEKYEKKKGVTRIFNVVGACILDPHTVHSPSFAGDTVVRMRLEELASVDPPYVAAFLSAVHLVVVVVVGREVGTVDRA